ncbi:MAG: hypothetical protein NVS3B7_16150 [Candidatus Elarobacter sp.]
MAIIKRVEQEIRNVEGFDVAIKASAEPSLPKYAPKYARAARNAFTVADWKRGRFERHYPGVDVDVLRADGRVANARTTLANLRAEYEAE